MLAPIHIHRKAQKHRTEETTSSPAIRSRSNDMGLNLQLAEEQASTLTEAAGLQSLYDTLFKMYMILVRNPRDRANVLHHTLQHVNSERLLFDHCEVATDVGFLFAKISGFNQLVLFLRDSQDVKAFHLLNGFYDRVDALAATLGLIKVKFDGSVIMIATPTGSLTTQEKAVKLYQMGLGLAKLFHQSELASFHTDIPSLSIQIGAHIADTVHTGPLGFNNPISDYIGMGVNLAARLASCQKGHFRISAAFLWHLPKWLRYDFDACEDTMKGIGKEKNFTCNLERDALILENEQLDALLSDSGMRIEQTRSIDEFMPRAVTPPYFKQTEREYQTLISTAAFHPQTLNIEKETNQSDDKFGIKQSKSLGSLKDLNQAVDTPKPLNSTRAANLSSTQLYNTESMITDLKRNIIALYRIIASQIPDVARRKEAIKKTAATLEKKMDDVDYGLSGIATDVGIVTADLKGFTALTGQLPEYHTGKASPQMMHLINAVYKEIDLEAERLGIVRLRFVGDCVILATPLDSKLSRQEKAATLHSLMISIIKIMLDSELHIKHGCGIRVGAHLCEQVDYGSLGLNDFSLQYVGKEYDKACSFEPAAPVFGINMSQRLYDALPNTMRQYYQASTEPMSTLSGEAHYVRVFTKTDPLLLTDSRKAVDLSRSVTMRRSTSYSIHSDDALSFFKSDGDMTDRLLLTAEQRFSPSSSRYLPKLQSPDSFTTSKEALERIKRQEALAESAAVRSHPAPDAGPSLDSHINRPAVPAITINIPRLPREKTVTNLDQLLRKDMAEQRQALRLPIIIPTPAPRHVSKRFNERAPQCILLPRPPAVARIKGSELTPTARKLKLSLINLPQIDATELIKSKPKSLFSAATFFPKGKDKPSHQDNDIFRPKHD